MSLRAKRLLLRVGIHSGSLGLLLIFMLVSSLAESPSASGFFGVVLLGYLVTLKVNPLPRLLERTLFQEIECFACGEVIDLVGSWNCGWGFNTWQPRHALAPCPVCQKEFQWLQCPRCENGVQT